MYDYPHYKENDRSKLVQFMKDHPFATMIGSDAAGRIELTQIPVLVEAEGENIILSGHMARKSSHQKAFTENDNVVVLFTSPHTYVSGSWYSGNPQQASTWNYISVHARGKLKFGENEELIELLRKLSLHFEKGNTGSSTIYDNLPGEYKEKLLKAIVPFTIEVAELENVFKLSQNRDEKSYINIISKLEAQDSDGRYIAEKMKERQDGLFR